MTMVMRRFIQITAPEWVTVMARLIVQGKTTITGPDSAGQTVVTAAPLTYSEGPQIPVAKWTEGDAPRFRSTRLTPRH